MVWNFGMGRPAFEMPRQDSQVVSSYNANDYADWQSGWQDRYNALATTARAATGREYMPDWWVEAAYDGVGAPAGGEVNPVWYNGPGAYYQDDGGVYFQLDRGNTPDFSGLNAEKAATEAAFTAARERQARGQQSYNQQTGSGFAGGIINDSYSNPFAGQITGAGASPGGLGDPGMPGVTMPWAQPWGTPGFGGPNGGQSIGGYNPSGQNGQQGGFGSGNSGWGGPFGKSNPWSLG